ncbi:MAG TPA: glycosyltransferase [Longimicrobium sp.]|nr:glycosyltransferase [Longimicrobium sp.]
MTPLAPPAVPSRADAATHDAAAPRRLRVAILLNQLANGGTPSRVLELSRYLRQGVELKVVVFLAPSEALVREYADAGVDVEVLGGRAHPRSYARLAALLRAWRPDVLHTFLPFAGTVGRLVGRWSRVPVLVSSHQSVRGNYRPLIRALDALTMRMADHVVCNSEEVERSFFGTYTPFEGEGSAGRVVTVVNGIDADVVRRAVAAADRGEVRAELGAAADDFVVVSVGRYVRVKDQATTLRAFAAHAGTDARLWLVGWGEDEAELRALAGRLGVAERVAFVVGARDVARRLAGADCFVLASHKEGLSGALLEAMAAGLPVAVSDIPQNLAVVGDDAGVRFRVGDADDLGRALLRIRRDPQLARALGERAAARVAERFSMERIARSLLALYAGAVRAAGATGVGAYPAPEPAAAGGD